MLTAILAFVNAHFSGLVAGVATESSIASLVYGIVMNDMVFALVLIAAIWVLSAIGTKVLAPAEPECIEVKNIGIAA